MSHAPDFGELADKASGIDVKISQQGAAKTMLALVLAWAMLLWPPLLNGGPFLMPDSTTYVRVADAAAYNLTDHRTAWTGELLRKTQVQEPRDQSGRPPTADSQKADVESGPIVISGRSVYYGVLPYLSYLLGSLWFTIAVQSMLTVACVALTLEALRGLQGRTVRAAELLLVVGFLALLTPAGYFAGFLMPDITTAFAILATAHILFFWHSMDRPRRWFWSALLVFSLASHSSNLLMAGVLAAALLALSPLRRLQLRRKRILLVIAAVLAAAALEAAFSFSVKRATGASPVRPPFVTARLVEDGPGYRYLRENCPRSGFLLCKYVDRLPQPSDNFLWDARAGTGMFSALPPAEARMLAREQGRFVLAVLIDRPLDVAKSSLSAVGRQAAQIGLSEFNYLESTKSHMARKLPRPYLEDVRRSAAFNGAMPVELVSAATLPVTLLSLIAIVWAALAAPRRNSRSLGFALIVCLMLALNAAICGMLSTPHERYLMRAIWVLPLVAICLLPPIAGMRSFRAAPRKTAGA